MGIEPHRGKSKLGHMGFSHNDGTSLAQTLDNQRVRRGGRLAPPNTRTSERRLSFYVKKVFDRNNTPIKRAKRTTVRSAYVGSIGLKTRRSRINSAKNPLSFAPLIELRQYFF